DREMNFEPTFAPIASGGYFWVVFTTRRTYGNLLTGRMSVTKQLWVAAIDQNVTPGKDPSHPAFRLNGQGAQTLNMRGFWALEPCKADGATCESGADCCGGYCDDPGSGPICTSTRPACARNGDRCDTTGECCEAATGVTCINHFCAEPSPPR